MKKGGQFGAEKGGQFAPESGGQFRAEKGGQFERIFHGALIRTKFTCRVIFSGDKVRCEDVLLFE